VPGTSKKDAPGTGKKDVPGTSKKDAPGTGKIGGIAVQRAVDRANGRRGLRSNGLQFHGFVRRPECHVTDIA